MRSVRSHLLSFAGAGQPLVHTCRSKMQRLTPRVISSYDLAWGSGKRLTMIVESLIDPPLWIVETSRDPSASLAPLPFLTQRHDTPLDGRRLQLKPMHHPPCRLRGAYSTH